MVATDPVLWPRRRAPGREAPARRRQPGREAAAVRGRRGEMMMQIGRSPANVTVAHAGTGNLSGRAAGILRVGAARRVAAVAAAAAVEVETIETTTGTISGGTRGTGGTAGTVSTTDAGKVETAGGTGVTTVGDHRRWKI